MTVPNFLQKSQVIRRHLRRLVHLGRRCAHRSKAEPLGQVIGLPVADHSFERITRGVVGAPAAQCSAGLCDTSGPCEDAGSLQPFTGPRCFDISPRQPKRPFHRSAIHALAVGLLGVPIRLGPSAEVRKVLPVALVTARTVVGGLPWVAAWLPLTRREVLSRERIGAPTGAGARAVLGKAFGMIHGLRMGEGKARRGSGSGGGSGTAQEPLRRDCSQVCSGAITGGYPAKPRKGFKEPSGRAGRALSARVMPRAHRALAGFGLVFDNERLRTLSMPLSKN